MCFSKNSAFLRTIFRLRIYDKYLNYQNNQCFLFFPTPSLHLPYTFRSVEYTFICSKKYVAQYRKTQKYYFGDSIYFHYLCTDFLFLTKLARK